MSRGLVGPRIRSPVDQLIGELKKAVTSRGPELSEAIRRGRKDVENRDVRLLLGWVTLHTGKSEATEEMREAILRLSPPGPPQADASTCARGVVVGVMWVERSVDFQSLREEFGCGYDCDVVCKRLRATHQPHCRLSPYAIGPQCSIIAASIRLSEPGACRGQVGCWS